MARRVSTKVPKPPSKNTQTSERVLYDLDAKLDKLGQKAHGKLDVAAAERGHKLMAAKQKERVLRGRTKISIPNMSTPGTTPPNLRMQNALQKAAKEKRVIDVSGFKHMRPLTDIQREFIRLIGVDGYSINSARGATGMSYDAVQRLLARSDAQDLMKTFQAEYREVAKIKKAEVLDGFKEAIDMAKLKGEPLTMIAGWREIARLCGYYEPQKMQVSVNVSGQVMLEKMSTLSDEQLLEMMQDSNAVDAEFEEIIDDGTLIDEGTK